MNCNSKKLLTVIMTVAMAFCMLFTFGTFSASADEIETPVAPTETNYEFVMNETAQVKTTGFEEAAVEELNNAIRFTSTIKATDDFEDALKNYNVKVKTIIAKSEELVKLTDKAFTKENLDEVGAKYQQVIFSEDVENMFINKDGYYTFNACLYNIKDENFTKELSAISYVEINGVATQYTQTIAKRSLWDVADAHKKALEEEYDNVSESEMADEYDYVSTLCATYEVKVTGFDSGSCSLTVKHGETLNDYIDVIKEELNVEGAAYINENADVLSEIITADKEDLALEMYALEFTLDGDTYSVSKGTYEGAGQGVVKVPAYYNGKTVKSVATAGFGINTGGETNQWLEKIILPDTLTNIGDRAFRRCFGLEYVQCRGVEALNKNAQFYACNNLKTLVVGARTFIDDEWDTETKANYGKASIYRDTTVNTQSGANLSIAAGSTLFCDADNNVVAKIYVYSATFDWGGFYYDANGDVVAYNADSYATYKDANSFNAPEDAEAVTYALNSAGTGYIAKPSTWMSQVLTRDDGVVNIPSSYNDKPVTETASNLFNQNGSIKKLILPETLTTIGAQLIRKCTSLTYLDIRGITASFDNSNKAYLCTGLTSIVIGPNCGRLGKDFEVDNATQAGKASVFFDGTFDEFNVTIGTTLKPNIAVSNRVYLLSQDEFKPGCFYFDDNGFAVAWDESSYYTYNNGTLTAPDSAQ